MLFQNAKIQDLNVIHNHCANKFSTLMLFQNAKIQDLNVIHNRFVMVLLALAVVSECKDTRFECNSQPIALYFAISWGCFRMQRYKIWM